MSLQRSLLATDTLWVDSLIILTNEIWGLATVVALAISVVT